MGKRLGVAAIDYSIGVWARCTADSIKVLLIEGCEIMRPKTLEEQAAALQQRREALERRRNQLALVKAQQGVRDIVLQLGTYTSGDTFTQRENGVYQRGRNICFEDGLLNKHALVVGLPGAGKTVTLVKLVYEILSKTERDVFFVDGKGEDELATQIRALAVHAGRGNTPVFRLGGSKQGHLYHGFAGSKEAIYERLAAMMDLDDKNTQPFWQEIAREILMLVCGYGIGIEPPRSFEDVRQRVNLNWLKKTYRDAQAYDEVEVLDEYDQAELAGVSRTIRNLARAYAGVVDPSGFSFETTPTAIFSIAAMAAPDTAGRFLKFLVEDLTDFIGRRQGRPAVILIDEFGAFGNENIIRVLNMARSFQLGVILATQNEATLGEEPTRSLILNGVGTHFLMQSNQPESIAQLAGTILGLEATTHFEEGQAVNKGGVRLQHQFKVQPNDVRQLLPGEGFLIRMGKRARVAVSPVDFGREGIQPPPAERITGKPQQLAPPTESNNQPAVQPKLDPDLEL